MAVPKHYELINPALQALHALGGSASIAEHEACVAEALGLSEEDLAEAIGNQSKSRFAYNLSWARSYLKRYGLVENTSRGVWALTGEGTRTKEVDGAAVNSHVRSGYLADSDAKESDADPEQEEELRWKAELLELLKSMKPDGFERLCMRVLRESGFSNVEVSGRSGDGGIDGRGVVRLGGILSFHVYFQCKRYRDAVPVSVIRDFRGAMSGRADKGVVITTGRFTHDAEREALRDGAIPLDLINGDDLVEKLKDLQLGVQVRERVVEDVEVLPELTCSPYTEPF